MSAAPIYGKARRIPIIDAVRGIMILYVVLYHLLYDLWMFGLIEKIWLTHPLMEAVHVVCYSTLVAFSGISVNFSRNNLKRGLILFGEAWAITLVTWVLDQHMFVRFGVLHFLGLAAILYHFIRMAEPALEKARRACRVPDGLFPLVMFLLYVWTYATVHQSVYDVEGLAWLGFRNAHYASSDYFPMVPFFFLYLFGVWMGKKIVAGKFPDWFYKINIPGMDAVGRKSIWIYLIHQPVIYGVVWLITTYI